MTDSPKPLTPEEIAEGRRLGGQIAPRAEFRDWLWANAYRLLSAAERLVEDRRCHVCEDATDLCCSDCRINLGARVYVCRKPACRDGHERKCSAKAERLAECERQLAEAQAVIVFDRQPESDFTWKRPPFYAAAVEAAHAASRHPKEPEHE